MIEYTFNREIGLTPTGTAPYRVRSGGSLRRTCFVAAIPRSSSATTNPQARNFWFL